MQNTTTFRPAIAMIELIFAIVIMGIALLSVPNLISTSSQSSLVTIQQEGIAMAASHTNALMTYTWDEQNTDTVGFVTNKIHVSASGDTRLSLAGIGLTIPGARTRTFAPGGIGASAITSDANDTDDIDDFNNMNTNTIEAVIGGASYAADEGEYIDVNVSQTTTVSYGLDVATYDSGTGVFTFHRPFLSTTAAPPASTTNIKLISTNLRSNSPDLELQEKDISFNAFMCNIGANNPHTKGSI